MVGSLETSGGEAGLLSWTVFPEAFSNGTLPCWLLELAVKFNAEPQFGQKAAGRTSGELQRGQRRSEAPEVEEILCFPEASCVDDACAFCIDSKRSGKSGWVLCGSTGRGGPFGAGGGVDCNDCKT